MQSMVRLTGYLAGVSLWIGAMLPVHAQHPVLPAWKRLASSTRPDPALAGTLLLTELNCTSCHAVDDPLLRARGAPRLDTVGHRADRGWLRAFLADPSSSRPGTSMPALLSGISERQKNAVLDALVAYLKTLRSDYKSPVSTASNPVAFEFWKKGDARRGRELFHRIGCVACHEPDPSFASGPGPRSQLDQSLAQLDAEELAELGLTDQARPVESVPLINLADRHDHESLTYFLLNPLAVRPDGRMPSSKLNPSEASDLAAWLIQREQPQRADDPSRSESGSAGIQLPIAGTNPDLVIAGARYFKQYRCNQCHEVSGEPNERPEVAARSLTELDPGKNPSCLQAPEEGLPLYRLSPQQAEQLRGAIEQYAATRQRRSEPGWQAELQLHQYNCVACHSRNGRGGVGPQRRAYFATVGDVDLGDEGRLPPPLDHVGRKLTAAAFQLVLQGKGDIRPHMQARMPVFGFDRLKALPGQLAAADDASNRSADAVFGQQPKLIDAGRELMDVGCVQCHPFAGERLPGVIGIDLATVQSRLRPEWLKRFLLNPIELKPRTRMPTFFPNGRSATPTVLDGDVDQQLSAMWAYLADVPRRELPRKLVEGKLHDFEVVPRDQPVVLRTFMKRAGPLALAVGFPDGIHYAFDAEQPRLVELWRGRFLDAHGTWYDRFTPPAEPLGTDRIVLPAGMLLAPVTKSSTEWPRAADETVDYDGYRLDKSRVPTLLYRLHGARVAERIQPVDSDQLERMIEIQHQPDAPVKSFMARIWTGRDVQSSDDRTIETGDGLRLEVMMDPPGSLQLIERKDSQEWRAVPRDRPFRRLAIRYHWTRKESPQ